MVKITGNITPLFTGALRISEKQGAYCLRQLCSTWDGSPVGLPSTKVAIQFGPPLFQVSFFGGYPQKMTPPYLGWVETNPNQSFGTVWDYLRHQLSFFAGCLRLAMIPDVCCFINPSKYRYNCCKQQSSQLDTLQYVF